MLVSVATTIQEKMSLNKKKHKSPVDRTLKTLSTALKALGSPLRFAEQACQKLMLPSCYSITQVSAVSVIEEN